MELHEAGEAKKAPSMKRGGQIAEGNQGGEDIKTPPVVLRMTAPSW